MMVSPNALEDCLTASNSESSLNFEAISNNVNVNDSLDKVKEFLIKTITNHFGNNVIKIKGNISIQQGNGKVIHLQLDNFSNSLQEEPIDLSTPVDFRTENNECIETPVDLSDNSEVDPIEDNLENGLEIDLKPIDVSSSLDATINFVAHQYEPPIMPSTSEGPFSAYQSRIDEYFKHEKDTHAFKAMAKELQRMDRRVKKRGIKKFQCNQCNTEFSSLDRLASHTTSVHETYRCMECTQTFTQRSNLQRHSLKHIGFKPFKCGVCEKGYYRKDHLVRHIEISHPGSDPKSNTRALISSAKCLSFISYCRNTGRDPSNREHLQDYNDSLGQYSIESGESSPVGHGQDVDVVSDDDQDQDMDVIPIPRPSFLPIPMGSSQQTFIDVEPLDRDEDDYVDLEDDEEGDVEESPAKCDQTPTTANQAAEDQYYETESGERVLIVQPQPVPWPEFEVMNVNGATH